MSARSLRIASDDDRRAFCHRRGICQQWQFLPYLERGITQFARIDVCNVGGLTESMKVASLAESHYIDLMPHNRWADLHRRDRASSGGRAQLRVARTPRDADGSGKFMDEDLFPEQCELVGRC